MKISKNYHNYDDRKSFNNIPCTDEEELLPVVLNQEMKAYLGEMGYDPNNIETWRFPNAKESVPIIFVPHKVGNKSEHMKWFNNEVSRYLKHDDFTDNKALSLDKFIEDLEKNEGLGFDPTGTNKYEENAELLQTFELISEEINAIDPKMKIIVRLLFEGYPKKEIIKIANLKKGKTQNYAFIDKTQKIALEIYNKFYK